jgi:hypothetical protein
VQTQYVVRGAAGRLGTHLWPVGARGAAAQSGAANVRTDAYQKPSTRQGESRCGDGFAARAARASRRRDAHFPQRIYRAMRRLHAAIAATPRALAAPARRRENSRCARSEADVASWPTNASPSGSIRLRRPAAAARQAIWRGGIQHATLRRAACQDDDADSEVCAARPVGTARSLVSRSAHSVDSTATRRPWTRRRGDRLGTLMALPPERLVAGGIGGMACRGGACARISTTPATPRSGRLRSGPLRCAPPCTGWRTGFRAASSAAPSSPVVAGAGAPPVLARDASRPLSKPVAANHSPVAMSTIRSNLHMVHSA